MRARNVTIQDLEMALDRINEKYYEGNIVFKSGPVQTSKGIQFTLKVRNPKLPGHQIGFSHPSWTNRKGNPVKPKRLAFACWHVHGDFFDALFAINPKAIVYSGSMHHEGCADKITRDGGNWVDWNAGSEYAPQWMSELCECAQF